MEGEKFKWDVGVQAIGGPFRERGVENCVPFWIILFGDQPKGMDLKIWEGGGGGGEFERVCKAAKFNFFQEVFFSE